MSDVNLNSSNLTPRSSSTNGSNGEQRSARASSSLPAEGIRNFNQSSRSTGAAPRLESVSSSEGVKESRAAVAQEQADDQRSNLDSAVSQLNDFVQSVQRNLEFEVDENSGRTIVRVIDQVTDEVIRVIPDEMALRLAENLQQDEPLVLLNIRV
ncbi:MAG: flagellar protein FlaG [Halomonadaceae bacterium]|nr:MAG: flagellar protein FlaG [Halomonadaceae bacterium]